MISRMRVSSNDRLTVDGCSFRLVARDGFGCSFESADGSGETVSYTYAEMREVLRRPGVIFDPGYYLPGRVSARRKSNAEIVGSLPEAVQSEVVWRHAYVEVFLKLELQKEVKRVDSSIAAALPRMEMHVNKQARAAQSNWSNPRAGKKNQYRDPPCPKTLRSWVTRFEQAEFSPLGLIPGTHRSGNRNARFCLESTRLLGECLGAYLSLQRLNKKNVAQLCAERFKQVNKLRRRESKPELAVPSRRKVERAIAKLDPYYTCVQRYGIEQANRKFTLHEDGIAASYPMERIEIDEWCVDLITILSERGALDHLSGEELALLERGRRWLYLAIDCATRCIVGMRLAETPNGRDALAVLSDVTRDKSDLAVAAGCKSTWHHCGGLSTVATDLGAAFVDDLFRTAVFEAYGTPETPPGGLAHLRGRVERIFGTFGTTLVPHLAGRTFSDPKERGDYPSVEMASISDDALMQMLTLFVVDVYHNTPHRGLNGETPNNCWKRLSEKMGVVPDLAETTKRRAFGIRYNRRVSGKGVALFGIDYACAALREFHLHSHETHVDIKADLNDLGWIMVQIGQEWFVANALQKCFDGISYDQWEATARELRLRHRAEAAIHEQTVSKALNAILEINSAEQRRFGVALKRLTPGGLRKAKEDLFLGLTILPEEDEAFGLPAGEGLMGHVIRPSSGNTDGSTHSEDEPDSDESEKQPRKKRWRFDDE